MGLLVLINLPIIPVVHATTRKVVFLTSGTSWTVPNDWTSSNNSIEVIGGGGSGGACVSSVGFGCTGGGGEWRKITNVTLTPGSSVSIQVGVGGASKTNSSSESVVSGSAGGDTYLCNSLSNCASISGTAVIVGAKAGGGGTGISQGQPAGGTGGTGGVGTSSNTGGRGGQFTSNSTSDNATGGGGAGGSNGAGNNGGDLAGNYGGTSAGGQGDGTGGGSGGSTGGGTGGNGTEWDGTHGSGGGGGGARATPTTTGSGGSYGGGGGAAVVANGNTAVSGAGAPGIIVITYGGLTLTGNVQFKSTLVIIGSLSKGSGSFVIDHPLDPKNKLLYHSFVESPDVKNIYDGIATLDTNGEAVVKLPEYFEALNKDFRYQYFPLHDAMPNLYVTEIHNNKFEIKGGTPHGEVSWQVTGIRHDPYILKHPIKVEVDKGPGQPVNKGEYIFPDYEKYASTSAAGR